MPQKHSSASVVQAFSVLGLDEGSTLDDIKSTYKQLALRTHPDKNPDNPDATTQFQRISEAYNVLLRHLDRSSAPERGPPRGFYPFSSFGYGGYYSDDEDDPDEYPDCDHDDDDSERLHFYMFVFEEMMRGHATPYSNTGFRRRPRSTTETPEQFRERLHRSREEQIAAQERRARETAERKARAENDRQRDRIAAEERQKAKVESKKAQADAQRKKAEKAARAQQQRAQTIRSTVFAAARLGDATKTKMGVWEDEVDAAGGEVKVGCHDFVKSPPKDPQETLLHIAAKNGDAELVEWLDAHGADPEERDSTQLTAFHVALQHGHAQTVKYFFEAYPPKESESKPIYSPPKSKNLLLLALDSREPQMVWMILDNGLASSKDISIAWAWVSSSEGTAAMNKQFDEKSTADHTEKVDDIMKLLMRFGGFTPPPTPKSSVPDERDKWGSGTNSDIQRDEQRQQKSPTVHRSPPEDSPAQDFQSSESGIQQKQLNAGRARGRGRGRGRGRARGRGRGRGAPVAES